MRSIASGDFGAGGGSGLRAAEEGEEELGEGEEEAGGDEEQGGSKSGWGGTAAAGGAARHGAAPRWPGQGQRAGRDRILPARGSARWPPLPAGGAIRIRRSGRKDGNASSAQYLLQVGSFRQHADADRRRGELALLGLEASVEPGNADNGRWYRVYLGPFENRSEMTRARSLTAQADMDTLLVKRESP